MKAIRIRDMIVNLDHVATVKFQGNDPEVEHDDRCSITFGNGAMQPLEIYGSDARETYERICQAMGVGG